MSAEPIRTAILGLGRAGYGIHVRLLRGRDDFKIVATADPDAGRREEMKKEFSCAAFTNLTSMLRKSDAELIVVATTSADHAKHSIAALKAGRHVVVEKPMATRLRDADRMIRARDESGKLLTVHQSQRWSRSFAFVRKMLSDERLGRVFFIRRGNYNFSQRNDWQTLRKYGGGSLNNNGVHNLDQCRLLLESEAVSVWGDLQRILSAGDAEDHCQVVMRGASGRVIEMDLTAGCASPAPLPSWLVMGTRGALAVDHTDKAHLRWAKAIPPLPEPEDAPIVRTRSYGVQGEVPALEFASEEMPADADPGPDFYTRLRDSIRGGAELAVKPEECRAVIDIMVRARKGTAFPA
jgi:predicted dehydrogenase